MAEGRRHEPDDFWSKTTQEASKDDEAAASQQETQMVYFIQQVGKYLFKLGIIKDKGVRSMISIPVSLSFGNLLMTSSAPAKSAGMPDTRPKIHSFNQRCPIQSRLERKNILLNCEICERKIQKFKSND